MQVVFKNEVEGVTSRRTDSVDPLLYTGKISKYLEREYYRIEQGGKTMKEFVQDFKRVVRSSKYEECPLIEEFKQDMNTTIRRRLMEAENQPSSIE